MDDYPLASRHAVPEEDIIEARAFIDLFMVAPQTLVDQAQFSCLQLGAGFAISLPSAPAIGLNRILGIVALEDLDTAYEWMSKKAGRRYLQVNAATAPQQTHDWIRKRGFVPQGNGWAKLRRAAPSTPLIQSGEVCTRQVKVTEADIFGSMMCVGFNFPANLAPLWSAIVGMDGWSCFFAELEGTLIATGDVRGRRLCVTWWRRDSSRVSQSRGTEGPHYGASEPRRQPEQICRRNGPALGS
ncbi:hypothetical protein QO002_004297 [Pararhizobium capsulatum DSM 1112]|uniref:N-acetyltransferase domain-containing protein n=1 Tax=Pararhizobium capsulatum DSM 1112 TaxID=1121113 RepID=A0ABU0BV13_9HYPH|nr:hypothetical protein [Pararhizobium capsulatum DSM 1112]